MSTTIMVCLGILSLCTMVIGVSTVIVHTQDIKLKRIQEKNKKIHLLDFAPPSVDETQREIPVVKYEKWLPYCQDAFGCTKFFKCSKCNNVTEMHELIDHSISYYYPYCPHCGSAMLHRVDE